MRIMIALIVSCLLAGCAASSSSTPASTQASSDKLACAQCLVCKKNADLACVDVDVDANTPRAQYQGKTYYFCSDECKQEFLKNPGKYIAAK